MQIECPERTKWVERAFYFLLLVSNDKLRENISMHFLYMIKNSSNKLYVGVTENPEKRLATHNSLRGAKFTKYLPDFKIFFLEKYENLQQARKREIQIKKWSRSKKEILIERYKNGLETKI
jgi:putative endonuclease